MNSVKQKMNPATNEPFPVFSPLLQVLEISGQNLIALKVLSVFGAKIPKRLVRLLHRPTAPSLKDSSTEKPRLPKETTIGCKSNLLMLTADKILSLYDEKEEDFLGGFRSKKERKSKPLQTISSASRMTLR